ncbi:AMP-binding protein [Myceligenerans halotolerans]
MISTAPVDAPSGDALPLAASALPGRPAILTTSGAVLTYADLRDVVDAAARHLPDAADGRRLVHLPLRARLDDVVAYLATLRSGHVALVAPDDDRADAILGRYRPDVAATGDRDRPFEVLSAAPRHLLHPDLALLLSTSGSTGSPKLVRLSRDNVLSNARAIAAALRLTEADRAVTSLPLHYTFGLSVLHSHLAAGASVVLHEGSVLGDDLWDAMDRLEVTTLAAVPHTLELLDSTGVLERPHPSLRLVAQAGGRMAPDRVLRTAALGREHGWGLSVMYGQTEATARICVLDPALVADHPDAVGHPVAGTSLRLDTTVPEAADGAGEVVVRGPGVMMGYAEHADDLALGAMLDELRTGDLGRIGPDGMLRLTGRRSGFVKVMGLRIDVARVEAALDATGRTACVGGDEQGLTVVVGPDDGGADHGDPAASARGVTGDGAVATRSAATPETATVAEARRLVCEASGLGPAAVAVVVAPLPRLSNGKVDRAASTALVRAASAGTHDASRTAGAPGAGSLAGDVARSVGHLLGLDAVDLDRSFVQLGGDSLSHVQASVRLEQILGPLPRGWHHLTLAELVAHGETQVPAAAPGTGRVLRWTGGLHSVETSVLLRALAVIAICATHAHLFRFPGGAHTLLVVAGFNAAHFALSRPTAGGRWRSSARTLLGIAVPTIVVALVGMVTHDRYGWANVLLANWTTGDVAYGQHNELWFVDALLACTVLLAAVLTVPAVGRAWQRDPWRVAFAVAVVALVPRFVILVLAEGVLRGIMPTVFWLFAVGAALAFADTRRRRLLTFAVAVAGGVTFFPDDPLRNLTILAGIALLTFVPAVRVPARLVPLLGLLAAASLYVYLVQFPILDLVPTALGGTVAAITAGCLAWWLADRPVRRLQDLAFPAR